MKTGDFFWFAGAVFWFLSIFEMPNTIPWWIRLMTISFFCFLYAIQKTVWNIEKKVQ